MDFSVIVHQHPVAIRPVRVNAVKELTRDDRVCSRVNFREFIAKKRQYSPGSEDSACFREKAGQVKPVDSLGDCHHVKRGIAEIRLFGWRGAVRHTGVRVTILKLFRADVGSVNMLKKIRQSYGSLSVSCRAIPGAIMVTA